MMAEMVMTHNHNIWCITKSTETLPRLMTGVGWMQTLIASTNTKEKTSTGTFGLWIERLRLLNAPMENLGTLHTE